MNQKHKQQKKKQTSSKSETFVLQKTPLRKWKAIHKWGKIVANHISDWRLVPKMYKLRTQNPTRQPIFKIGKGLE